MAITSGDLNKLDTAMQQYFNAVYRASHAAYKDGFSLSARRAAVSDAVLEELRGKVTAAADPVNQAVFTLDSYAARQVEKMAREAATKDTRAGIDREEGLSKASASFKKGKSLEIIAEYDDSNMGARGVPGQTSHASLIKEARGGNLLAQNFETPGARKSTGGGLISSAHAAESAAKAAPAAKALTGKVDISGAKDPAGAVQIAINEALPGYKNFPESTKTKIVGLLEEVGGAVADDRKFPQLFVNLDDKIKNSTGEDKEAYHHARRILLRAREFHVAAKNGKVEASSAASIAELNTYLRGRTPEMQGTMEKNGWRAEVSSGAKEAPGGAVPAAPSGDDEASYGAYKGQTYASSDMKRGTVREAQLYLEALGLTTGNGNSARFGAGQTEKSAMDGIVGEKTDAAIRKFQNDHELEVTGKLDEATMAKLKEVAGPKLESAKAAPAPAKAEGEGQTATPAAEAKPAAAVATAGADVAKAAIAATAATPQEAADQRVAIMAPKNADVRKIFIDSLKAKASLTQTQIDNISVVDGIIQSPDILRLEKALNAVRGDAPALTEDGKWDDRLKAIMTTANMGTFLGAVFGATDVASSGGPGTTPGQGSGAGNEKA